MLEDALRQFEQAVALRENYAEAQYSIGSIQLQQRQWVPALESFTDAAAANTKYANAYYGAGLAFIALGKERDAEEMLNYARELFKIQNNSDWADRTQSVLAQMDR